MRRVDSEPGRAEAEHSGPLAVMGETDTAPTTVSEGQGALPVAASNGAGARNAALLSGILQVAAGAELHGDDPSAALPRVQAAVEAMTGIERGNVISDMTAAQLIVVHTLGMNCYRRAHGNGELEVWRQSLNHANVSRHAGRPPLGAKRY